MTIDEVVGRLLAAEGGAMPIADLRAMARDLYGKDRDREVDRLLEAAHYWIVAEGPQNALQFPPAFINRMRRDYSGPLDPEPVAWSEVPLSVTVEDGARRMIITPSGAVPSVIHWLQTQMAPPAAPVETVSET